MSFSLSGEIMKTDELVDDKKYFEMWGVNTDEQMHIYYDESNNCRKFWLDANKEDFNHDCYADFVLAGVASCEELEIPFDELRERFGLQKNITELKSKIIYRGKDFLECMASKQTRVLINIINDYDLYIHYDHVNNFYYTIVEILDSITNPMEIDEFGFDYFKLKSTLYNMLIQNIATVRKIMIKYSYPNIKTEDIRSFCLELLASIDMRYNQKPDEKFVSGMLKRAAGNNELVFIQNNTDYVMQNSFAEFYVSPIMTFPKSVHHFDEELSIQEEVKSIICQFNNGNDKDNYEFINSKDNTLIQISDLVAGLLGKMFRFFNTTKRKDFRGIISDMTEQQLRNCYEIQLLRVKSNERNKGFLHSLSPISVWESIDDFFNIVYRELINRKNLI